MTDQTTPPQGDNVVTPQAEPPKTDNAQESVEELKNQIQALNAKIEDQAQHNRASRDEALRLKAEKEELLKALSEKSEDIDPDDVKRFKQFAQKAGIPTQTEIDKLKQEKYEETQNESIEKFLAEFPEYKPENDPGDAKWNQLKQELAIYKNPSNPKDWFKLLTKAHKSLNTGLELEKGKALGMAKAKVQESISAVGSGSSQPSKKLTPEQQAVQDEMKKLRPNYFK